MKKISIKFKVTLWFTVFMAILASALFYIMITHRTNLIKDDARSVLVRNVDSMAAHISGENPSPQKGLRSKPGRRGNAPAPPPQPDARMYGEGVHIAIYNSDYNLLTGQIPFEFDTMDFEDGTVRNLTSNNEKYLVYDKKITTHSGEINWIKGVRNISNELDAVNSTVYTDFALIAFLILIAATGGYYIVKRSLEPVRKISETAKNITDSNDLTRRISLGEGKDEIYTLGCVFDKMLDKIEALLEKEKQFTSDASHELRTPTAVILSECEYALDCASTTDEYKESLTVIKRQTDKISTLISQLLTLSRMDKDTFSADFQNTNISELLEITCEEQKEINRKDVSLEYNIEPGLYTNADPMLITRLFINLISNAYQYNKENGKIFVSLKKTADKLLFSVKDTGTGISEDDLPNLWERFYRVNKSRTSDCGNMGLGLSMVKQIAEIHNGTLDVKSKPDEGSEFIFLF